MSIQTGIEWTDSTWNPVRGCTKISPGCKHCYAETFSERFRGVPGHPFEFGFDLRLVPEKLLDPLGWRKPRRIFVNSMSDLFHEKIPDAYIDSVVEVMRLADWHVFQLLTKRADRMARFFQSAPGRLQDQPHIWLGVSVEDRRYGLPRIDRLRETPAAVRFLSIEPLIEDLGTVDFSDIDWVIVGGESGRGARPIEVSWVLSIREQCAAAEVPFFFKQWGGVQKKRNGRELQGRTYDELPAIQPNPAPGAGEREFRLRRARDLIRRVA